MRGLPSVARWYLVGLGSISAILIGIALLWTPPAPDDLLVPLAALPLLVLADYVAVEFKLDGDRLRLSLADAALIALIFIAGPAGALACALGAAVSALLRREGWPRALDWASHRSITYLALLPIAALQPSGAPLSGGPAGVVLMVGLAGAATGLRTFFAGTLLGLTRGRPLPQSYRASLRAGAWAMFPLGLIGATMAALWQYNPWLLLPGAAPLLLLQRMYLALAVARAESRRSAALAQRAGQRASQLDYLQATATAISAPLEIAPLVETLVERLAAMLGATAGWAILISGEAARLAGGRGLPPDFAWSAPAYAAEIRRGAVRQLGAEAMADMHAPMPWRGLVIIPLVLDGRSLGGVCLALDRPPDLPDDDVRALAGFAGQAALALEQARLFEVLRQRQDELIRSSKLAALGTFAAGIAHEFNNLLAGILGYAQLALLSDDVAEKNEALDVAVRACLRGRGITSGLLTFARRRSPQRGLHQLYEVIEETLALVERELAKAHIRIERRFQTVPPIICDPSLLAQVLINLITNARDAMAEHAGGVITLELTQQGDQIELVVRDTGVGIPEDLLDQVFQPFTTTKGALGGSHTPGTGLGLAVSYGIIESHGGTIVIESAVGRGTSVRVHLPINNLVPETIADPALVPPRSLQILVVEGDRVAAEPLAQLLESQGHHVAIARDGEAALRCYKAQPFDLVISNVVMPGMGGIEFLHQVHAIDPGAQVLMMLGQSVSNQADLIMRAGAFETVTKPFVVDDLLAAIARGAHARSPAASSAPPAAA